jgi:hypothetical protein
MSDDLLSPENLSLPLLKSVLDAAFMETVMDTDGDLLVRDQINCYILLGEKKDRISFLARFGFKPEVSQAQRLECVNSINKDFLMVRAVAGENDLLRFTYDLIVPAEITKKAFVLTLKRFCAIPQVAVRERALGLVQ